MEDVKDPFTGEDAILTLTVKRKHLDLWLYVLILTGVYLLLALKVGGQRG